jgi:hypothetical protein
VVDMVALEIVSPVVEDERRAVIGQQPGTMLDPDRLNQPGPVAGNVQRLGDVVIVNMLSITSYDEFKKLSSDFRPNASHLQRDGISQA